MLRDNTNLQYLEGSHSRIVIVVTQRIRCSNLKVPEQINPKPLKEPLKKPTVSCTCSAQGAIPAETPPSKKKTPQRMTSSATHH